MDTKADKSRANKVPGRVRAIHLKCLNCMVGSSDTVMAYESTNCALHLSAYFFTTARSASGQGEDLTGHSGTPTGGPSDGQDTDS